MDMSFSQAMDETLAATGKPELHRSNFPNRNPVLRHSVGWTGHLLQRQPDHLSLPQPNSGYAVCHNVAARVLHYSGTSSDPSGLVACVFRGLRQGPPPLDKIDIQSGQMDYRRCSCSRMLDYAVGGTGYRSYLGRPGSGSERVIASAYVCVDDHIRGYQQSILPDGSDLPSEQTSNRFIARRGS